MMVAYSSNNSGGGWWLKDKDWIALEQHGWMIEWGGSYFCGDSGLFQRPSDKPDCGLGKQCNGHRRCETAVEAESHRWLGALAKRATRESPTLAEALIEFERITKQDVTKEGCNCCGPPHAFEWEGGYASGEELLTHRFPDRKIPKFLRAVLEAGEKGGEGTR